MIAPQVFLTCIFSITKGFILFAVVYVLVSVFVSCWAFLQSRKNKSKILRQGQILPQQRLAEIRQAIWVCLVYALSAYLISHLTWAGWYSSTMGGWANWDLRELLFLPILLLVYDAYTYWTHRALHTKYLFAFHLEHHLSVETTPWSAFRLTGVEAVIIVGFFHLVAWLTPLHSYTLLSLYLVIMTLAAIAHAGVELYGAPTKKKSVRQKYLSNCWNSVAFHDQHHRSPQTNFSAYFSFWDTLCKTRHQN